MLKIEQYKGLNKQPDGESEVLFEDIYKKYWSELYLFAYNMLRDPDLAKDVVQEVFVPLVSRRKQEEILDIRSFLIQAVKYQIYMLIRSEKVKLKAFEQLNVSDYDNSTNELLSSNELRQQIEQSVNSLPGQCRTIFSLKQEGHTARTIAAMTGLSQRTVEHQLYIAVKKLRFKLQDIISIVLVFCSFLLP
jgi:RNA polymerase sigma-70 factor (family 1)